MDIKNPGRFPRVGHRIHGDHGRRSRGIGSEFLPIAIDDRNRVAYAALLPDETAASATAFLALAHRWFAARGVRIHGLLTDNGRGYRGRIVGARCRQPLPDFLRYYNQQRFHMGINGLTPLQRLAQHR